MITPLDIDNKKFSKQVVNGYSVDEVDDFLDEISVEYERNYKELTELKEKNEAISKELEHYKMIEDTLQNALIMAQTTAEEVKTVARQQADQIIKEARLSSQNAVDDLKQEISMKQIELDDIKKQFDIFKAKMESLLISQLELLKDINEE